MMLPFFLFLSATYCCYVLTFSTLDISFADGDRINNKDCQGTNVAYRQCPSNYICFRKPQPCHLPLSCRMKVNLQKFGYGFYRCYHSVILHTY